MRSGKGFWSARAKSASVTFPTNPQVKYSEAPTLLDPLEKANLKRWAWRWVESKNP
jgi:hypothetical protein